MHLLDAVRCLVQSDPDHGKAMEVVLVAVLEEVVVSSTTRGLSARGRYDIAVEVVMRATEKSPLPVVGKEEPVVRAYFRTMLETRFLMNERSRRRRERTHQASITGEELTSPPPSTPVDRDLMVCRRALESVYDFALAHRMERFKSPLQTTWSQFCALTFDGIEMDALYAREGADTAEARDRAQQRIHKNLSRLREELLGAAREMAAAGLLTPEQVELVRGLVEASKHRIPGDMR
jgi:hypothetical protein